MSPLLTQTITDVKIHFRRPQTYTFSIALPALVLVFFGAVYGSSHIQGIKEINFQLPQYAVLAAMAVSFNTIGITIAIERGKLILKRMGGTPVPRWVIIVSLLVSAVILLTVVQLVLFAVGVYAYGASPKGNHLLMIGILAAGVICFATMAIAFGGLVKPDSAASMGPFIYIALSFLGGVFVPLAQFPHNLKNVASVLPSERMVDGLQQVMTYGHGMNTQVTQDIIALGIWVVVAAAVGIRFFRWE
jgi:ABC-2 type transport system permease protein